MNKYPIFFDDDFDEFFKTEEDCIEYISSVR
jgi:hypothetical protein